MVSNKKKLKEHLRTLKIPLLIIFTGELESRIIDLKKQGIPSYTRKSRTIDKIRQKRNIYREILLEKLKIWEKNKEFETGIDFSEAIDFDKTKETDFLEFPE